MVRSSALLFSVCIALPAQAQQKTDPLPVGSTRQSGGGIFDILGEALNPQLSTYVKTQKIANFDWPYGKVQTGLMLPSTGAVLLPVPAEYGIDRKLRLSRVNNQFVLVDPATRKIVQIVN